MAVTLERTTRDRFAIWFTTRPLWYLMVVAVAVNGLLFGVAPRPDIIGAHREMRDPFHHVYGDTVDQSSPLGWMLTDLLGIHHLTGLALFHLGVLIACLIACTYMVALWVSEYAGRLFVAAWFATPLANINVTWLGKPDHFTLLATVMIGVGPVWACAAGGLLIGFNHFEQGAIIILLSLVMRHVINRERVARHAAYCIAAFGVGRLIWYGYAAAINIQSGDRVSYILDGGVTQFVDVWGANIPTLVFGAFGVLWIPVIVWWRSLERSRMDLIALLFLLVSVATMLTLDATRVYSLLTFPFLLVAIRWWQNQRPLIERWLPWFLLAAVFVPRVVLWAGEPYVSSWNR